MWLHPKQGTDAALAMAMGHVILREFHLDRQVDYFEDYVRRYTDMPMLVRLVKKDGDLVPDRLLRAADFEGVRSARANNPDWKTVAVDEARPANWSHPHGSVGFRWGEQGKWNLEEKDGDGRRSSCASACLDAHDEVVDVGFPYFGNRQHDSLRRHRPSRRAGPQSSGKAIKLKTAKPWSRRSSTCSSPITASTAGLGGDHGGDVASTTTCLTRRPGRNGSPACPATASSRSRGSSRTTPRRPVASRW